MPRPVADDALLRVDASTSTGPVHGGAGGMLYGLGEPEVPATPLLEGARPRTVSQKPPGGAQHPTGDALETAPGFFAAGGAEMHVYLQDDYAQWPYENLGIDDFLARVRRIVARVAEEPDADRYVWVPFNEPDWIWYGDWPHDKERFFADWAAVHAVIRDLLPAARIVGPNDMVYTHERYADFLTWAAGAGLLPDVVSWHELQPEGLSGYRENHADLLEILDALGVPPIPVIVNEYGNRRDFANPAQVVQWLTLFEDTKVDANMAFWTAAGNLDDHAAGVQQANGGWWLLAWYADLVGETVRVTPPRPSTADTLQGIAAIDRAARQLDVLFGGTAAPPSVQLDGLPADVFGTEVDVSVWRTTWTGHEADALAPPMVHRERVRLVDGAVRVALDAGDPMAAYRLRVVPAEVALDAVDEAWVIRLEAEDGRLTEAAVESRTTDPQEYATSGGRDVGGLAHPGSRIDLDLDLVASGPVRLGIYYGTAAVPGRLALWIDGEFVATLDLPSTLTRAHRGRVDADIDLAVGTHEISLRTSDPGGVLVGSDVSIDRVDVTPVRPFRQMIPARLLRRINGARLEPGDALRPAAAYPEGGALLAFVATEAAGDHDVDLQLRSGGGPARLSIARGSRTFAESVVAEGLTHWSTRVHLPQGVSALRITGIGDVAVTSLEVRRAVGRPTVPVEVLADGVEGLRLIPLSHLEPGRYDLALRYSNESRESGHEYNTDVQSVRIEVTTGAGEVVPRSLPYTGVGNTWTVVLPVDLTGSDELRLRILRGAPRIVSAELAWFAPPAPA